MAVRRAVRTARRLPAPKSAARNRKPSPRGFLRKIFIAFSAGFVAAIGISGYAHLARSAADRSAVRVAALHTQFDAQHAMAAMHTIAGVIPRHAGSDGAQRVREDLHRTLVSAGWRVELQRFQLPSRDTADFANLIADFGPRIGRRPRIILAAAFDAPVHPFLSLPAASGSAAAPAVLLEIARVLARSPADARQVELAFLDARYPAVQPGSEDGLAGARVYCDWLHRSSRGRSVEAVLVLETLGGRNTRFSALPHSSPAIAAALAEAARLIGEPLAFQTYSRRVWSGELPFVLADFPALSLGDASDPIVLTMDDVPSRITPQQLAQTGRIVLAWVQLTLEQTPRR